MSPKLRIVVYAIVALIAAFAWWESRETAQTTPVPAPQASRDQAEMPPAGAGSGALAEVRSDVAFRSHQRLVDHYDKHGHEFGDITMAQYLHQAQVLRDVAAGGEVLEIVRADGVITRFDRSSGGFLAFNRDLTIRTYFRPRQGETYFRRQGRRGR